MSNLTGWLGLAYPWVKAAHVTFVIFWMAGLFLLPRLYVYHQETTVGSPEDRAWIEREARVRSIILTPAMLAVWILGLIAAPLAGDHIGRHGPRASGKTDERLAFAQPLPNLPNRFVDRVQPGGIRCQLVD